LFCCFVLLFCLQSLHLVNTTIQKQTQTQTNTNTNKNKQVSIKNIHIRYEDENQYSKKAAFSLGICLKELRASTTNATWEELFVSDSTKIFKQLTLRDFFVYFNDNSTNVEHPDELANIFGLFVVFCVCVLYFCVLCVVCFLFCLLLASIYLQIFKQNKQTNKSNK
jgi:hypothetical protein